MAATVDPLAGLIRVISLGDQVASAELYRRSSGKLLAVARRLMSLASTA
jgi:hypothetical protein